MGAFLDGIPFRINPKSVSWPYSVKVASKATMGGKVIQLYGVTFGDLVVEGEFGVGGPEAQAQFFEKVVQIIESQLPINGDPRPVRFHWPERGWDFWCFIKSMTQTNAQVAVSATNQDFNPGYRLTMFVQEDNGDITKAARASAAASFIARLSDGMGWKQTEWNGPMGSLSDILKGDTLLNVLVANRQRNFDSQYGSFFGPNAPTTDGNPLGPTSGEGD